MWRRNVSLIKSVLSIERSLIDIMSVCVCVRIILHLNSSSSWAQLWAFDTTEAAMSTEGWQDTIAKQPSQEFSWLTEPDCVCVFVVWSPQRYICSMVRGQSGTFIIALRRKQHVTYTHTHTNKHTYIPPKSWLQAVSESQTQMERNGGRREIRVWDGWGLEGDLNVPVLRESRSGTTLCPWATWPVHPDSQPYAWNKSLLQSWLLARRIRCDQLRQVAQIMLNPLITEIDV